MTDTLRAFEKYIDALAVQKRLITDVTDAINNLAGEQAKIRREAEKTRRVQESANQANAEALELQKDIVAENLRFSDTLMDVRREIMEVTHVTKGMNKTFFQAASGSKVWTAASRLLSGTGLWSIQNAVRGVIDVFAIYQTGQEKKIEISQKATKAMENYAEVESRYREEITKLAPALREAEAGNYDKLKAESASFRLMLDKNIEEEVALGLLKREINATDELLERQEKLIKGGRIRQMLQRQIAKIELMGLNNLDKLRNKIFGKREIIAKPAEYFTADDQEVKDGTKAVGDLKKQEVKGQLSGRQEFVAGYAGMGTSAEMISEFTKNNEGVMNSFKDTFGFLKSGKFWKGLSMFTPIGPTFSFFKNAGKIWDKVGEGFRKILPNMLFVFTKLKLAMTYFIMALLGIFVVVAFVKTMITYFDGYDEALKTIGAEGLRIGVRMSKLFAALLAWAGQLWKVIYSAFTGDMTGIIEGLSGFLVESAHVLLQIALASIAIGVALITGLMSSLIVYIKQEGFAKLGILLLQVLTAWWTYALIRWSVVATLSYVAGLLGAIPIGIALLVAGITFLVIAYWDKATSWLGGAMGKLGDRIVGAFRGKEGNYIPFFSEGGTMPQQGLAVVGEKGPELVNLPGGSRVYSNTESKSIMSSKGGNTINVHVNGRLGASDQEIRDIARKVGRLVSQEINRTTASSTRGM